MILPSITLGILLQMGVGGLLAEGFRRLPESAQELGDAHRLAIEAIEDEPWERWW